MENSILHFLGKGIKNLEKEEEIFWKNPEDMAALISGIRNVTDKLAQDILTEILEDLDTLIREDPHRVENWYIERRDRKQLVTTLGTITFHKTLFKNKETGKCEYLVDRLLALEPHERMTEEAEARMLEEVAEVSYRKSGELVSPTDDVSKQTVKNKIHRLEFPALVAPLKKREVEYLYIDADEDHVKLQYQQKKGDLTVNDQNRKNNCEIVKLIYVYEGIEREAPKSRRHKLIHPYYFSGTYEGEDNKRLWDEVYRYIEMTYDLDKVKRIYLNADGGAWIQGGKRRIAGIVSVLDEFHLQKYMIKATSHMLDSAEDARKELKDTIQHKTKEEFNTVMDRILLSADSEACRKRIEESRRYILSNWTAAKIRLNNRTTVKGCSAEGHVSHVLSSRMSSRPMGWSKIGCDKMAHLRAYFYNGGDMLELVRYQEKKLPKAAGAESDYDVISSAKITAAERKTQSDIGKYYDVLQASIAGGTAGKTAAIRSRIWGL